jgi:hypothetical protein
MPSPYEYTPRHRVIAQVVLFLLLAAVLGAAQLLASHRKNQGVLKLERVGWNGVTWFVSPAGWRQEMVKQGKNLAFVASDPARQHDGQPARQLRMEIEQVADTGADAALQRIAAGRPLTSVRPIYVGSRRGRAAILQDPATGTETAIAVAVQPQAESTFRIEVIVRGQPIGPQELRLLDDVCDETYAYFPDDR